MYAFLRPAWRCAGALLTAAFLANSLSAVAQAPVKQWDKTFGGSGLDYLSALQQTSDGGYILMGTSSSGIGSDKTDACKGGTDYWIVKIDASGNKQWDKTFGGSGLDALYAGQQTSDGGYIVGGWSDSGISGDKTQACQGSTDYWIVKLDAQGNKQWDKTFGGIGYDNLSALQQTSDGGYILGGESGIRSFPIQPIWDYWVVKLDASGNKQWEQTLGGTGDDALQTLQQTSDGGYIVGGWSDSGISGAKTQACQGSTDYWIVKLNASGTKQWDKTIGGTSGDVLRALRLTPDGGYILGGYSTSDIGGDKTQPNRGTRTFTTSDYWVVKLDAQGNKQWDKTVGGTDFDYLYDLQPTSDGGYILGGDSESDLGADKSQSSQGGTDYWIAKLDINGTKQWDVRLGGSDIEYLGGLQQTADGGYIIGGSSQSGASGDKSQLSKGSFDFWVVKLSVATPTVTAAAVSRHQLSIYPNPAQQRLTLPLPADAPRTGLRLALLDATGRVVLQKPLAAPAGSEVPVQLGQQPAGLYLLRLEGPGGYLATQRVQLQ